jgi:hypothetical protein
MKICICCSLTFTNEVIEVGKMLEHLDHEVLLPNGVINRLIEQPNFDPVQAKIKTNSWRLHIDKIRSADAVLICNFLKNCTPGYIGANTYSEIAAAHYFDKPIFALFQLPDQPYINEEIRSLPITILDYDLTRIPASTSSPATLSASHEVPSEPEAPTIDPRQATFPLSDTERPFAPTSDTPQQSSETSLSKLSQRLKTLLSH